MAVTKILARKAPLHQLVNYVLNGNKTDDRILTASQRCSTEFAASRMMKTKRQYQQTGGVQCYHIIQSFQPGEITPELALEIAQEFASQYLSDYEVVIGTHVDRHHIHSHLVFNSVNAATGKKYHSNAQTYYQQIRATSDRLCREHGLSVMLQGESSKSMSYIEWLRQSKGQPTYLSMLEAGLRESIEDASDLGHFFMMMEHKGYEIHHGNRLGFRLRGQERFMYPGRRNPLFTEEGIQKAIAGNLLEIEAGRKPVVVSRQKYQPYKKHPKYTGFLALYYHYLYLLGKIEKRQYPPRMTPHLRQEVMKFEKYREQFAFLREHNISSPENMARFVSDAEAKITALTKQRTILNVRKKQRRALYNALADAEALAPVKKLYEEGLPGMETEYARYLEAVKALEECSIPREQLTAEKAAVYQQAAELNQQIRAVRRQIALCREIQNARPQMEQDIQTIETKEKAVTRDEHRRR